MGDIILLRIQRNRFHYKRDSVYNKRCIGVQGGIADGPSEPGTTAKHEEPHQPTMIDKWKRWLNTLMAEVTE